ncbi:MAG TPA: penicillin acylase family protein, partial [Candidatus Angelobacter sp.]|nr:penicillin acylase family protein [Candidatus Angelobacter sp.]
MATTTVAATPARRSPAGILLRIIFWLLVLLLVAGALAFAWFYNAARASLPQLDGSIALSGLTSPVSVVRDAQGVPHLTSASLADLFFAQGYVTAQDRLWQMDLTRRAVGGEMAEIFPASSAPPQPVSRATAAPRPRQTWVDYDKQQRTMRLRAVSDRVAQQLPARDRVFFEAYAKGVNAYIEQHRDNLPIEFRILGYKPREWTVTDSLLIGIGMSQLLNPQYETEYWREKIAAKLSPELMADLYPPSSPRDHPPASEAGATANVPADQKKAPQSGTPTARTGIAAPVHEADTCEACLPGSNNWVVSGAHTVSGKPLLSNDMHLPHRVPGVWYELQLHSGDFNIEGFSLPGL